MHQDEIDAVALGSAVQNVVSHSPEQWPTASYKSGWDTDGVFDEIIAGCSQLSPGAAFLEECKAMDDDDEVPGL